MDLLHLEFSVDGENYGPSPLMVAAGTYEVTARDVYGCIGTMEEAVFVGPDAIEINAIGTPELCVGSKDGQVSWAPVGGVGSYTYAFDGVATSSTVLGGLDSGEYVVSVSDGDGCVATDSVTVAAAMPIEVLASVTDESCFGGGDGQVVISATGGTGDFAFSNDGVNYSQNNEFVGLGAGNFDFFVTDDNGCQEAIEVSVGAPDAILVTAIVSQGSLDGEGTIDVTVVGGQPPYSFERIIWVFGVHPDLENISTGLYTVEVTDSLGCTEVVTVSIETVRWAALTRGVQFCAERIGGR